jgi:hypothetical protein
VAVAFIFPAVQLAMLIANGSLEISAPRHYVGDGGSAAALVEGDIFQRP